jgi:hypothetical protein
MPTPSGRAWAVLAIAASILLANSLYSAMYIRVLSHGDTGATLAGAASLSWLSIAGGAVVGAFLIWLAGARWGVLAALIVWTFGALIVSLGGGAGIETAHVLQGLTSSAFSIGAIQAVAEWFPRGFHGIGASLLRASAVIVPPLVGLFGMPFASAAWRGSFLVLAVLGAVLGVLWVTTLTPRENVPPPDRASEGALAFGSPATWALIIGSLFVGLYSILLFSWMPLLVTREYGLRPSILPVPISIGVMILGAFFSDLAIQSGKRAGAARGIVTLVAAVLMFSIASLLASPSPAIVTGFLCLSYAGYQLWSAVMHAAVMDSAPAGGVGLAIGLSIFTSQLAGIGVTGILRGAMNGPSVPGLAIGLGALAVLAMPMSALVWRISPETSPAPASWQTPPWAQPAQFQQPPQQQAWTPPGNWPPQN